MFDDVLIYVPSRKALISISEGIGDNLLPEDIENGYVDYINYSVFDTEDISCDDVIEAIDGGTHMYKEFVQIKFTSLTEVIEDILEDAFNTKDISFVLLEGE